MSWDLHPELAGILATGLTRNRRDRPVRNGRWYLASPAGIEPAGWGDLAFADLDRVAGALPTNRIFIVIPERAGLHLTPESSQPTPAFDWHATNRPAPPASGFADHATYVVLDGHIRIVDHYAHANRQGAVWISPGHRQAATGRTIRTAPRRVLAISPDQLRHRLLALSANPSTTGGERRP